MDTSREKAAGPGGDASIRLRYSTQLQVGGRAHTIDAEISLPVGASQELREQIIRETELGVEQLARQLRLRGTRPAEAAPAPLRPGPETPAASRSEAIAHPQSEPVAQQAARQPTRPSAPATHAPISESMPATPATGGEGRQITLSQFISAINKHLNITQSDAKRLLNVDSLSGLNYLDTYRQLEAIVKQQNAEPTAGVKQQNQETTVGKSPSQPTRPMPVVEAPRQTNQAAPRQAGSQATPPRSQGQAALKEMTRTNSRATQSAPAALPESNPHREPEAGKDFAGSPKAPIPIHIGVEVVRDTAARSYQFHEEEDEEFEFEDEDEEEEEYALPIDREQERASAQLKLERLKSIRGSQAASAGRLKVLDTLIDSQLNEEQLQTIIQAAWGASHKKKLKNEQVEELISWAKEDYFVEEATAMLKLIQGTTEE